METKRKAQASAANAADADERSSKRRKLLPKEQYDLYKGESVESTTQYGLGFLEQIRRTSDKSGRLVAGYFEKLIPKAGNEDYYKQIRMPISLETIERKLHNGDFATLAELESYVKRMVQNAKEYYPKNSQVFDDAERVRKATSNYMTKTNPAYKLVPHYSALPTPIPNELLAEDESSPEADTEAEASGEAEAEDEAEDEAEAEVDAGAEAESEAEAEAEVEAEDDAEAEAEAEEEVEEEEAEEEEAEEEAEEAEEEAEDEAEEEAEAEDEEADAEADAETDAEVEAEAEAEANEQGGQDEDAKDEDAQDEDAEGEDDDAEQGETATPASDERATPTVRKRGPGRPPKNPALHAQKMAERASSGGPKHDHEYENVSYKGLSFQQAQEKIVEEVIRRPDEDDDNYAYFEPFINLPPRSLKDYYSVIKEPLSLKKLQKLVKGIHGRGEKTGISEFKSWAAFEEKAALLWQNAYFYNEDGSEIANMAKELEKMFKQQLKEAKAVVAEPPQQKIKIKMPQGQETPAPNPRKITIHVASTRGSSAESPAPKSGGSVSSAAAPNGTTTRNSVAAPQPKPLAPKARSTSATSPSPSVSTKREEAARNSPAIAPRPHGITPVVAPAPPNGQPAAPVPALPNGHSHIAPAPINPYDARFRAPGREPLITNVAFRTHPALNNERRFRFKLPPHPKETQRSVTMTVPLNHWKQQIIISVAPSIQEQQRAYKLFVIVNGVTLGPAIPVPSDPIEHGAKLYEANLHHGINTIQIQMVAAMPKGQKLPNGSEVEVEKITLLANLTRY